MSISKPQNNSSLICRIQYAFTTAVDTFVKYKNFAAVIALKENESWNDFYGTISTLSFTDKTEKQSAGSLYRSEIKLFNPGSDPLKLQEIIEMDGKPMIVLASYQDGLIKVMGNLEEPAVFLLDRETSAKDGSNVIFSAASIERCRFFYADLQSIPTA